MTVTFERKKFHEKVKGHFGATLLIPKKNTKMIAIKLSIVLAFMTMLIGNSLNIKYMQTA